MTLFLVSVHASAAREGRTKEIGGRLGGVWSSAKDALARGRKSNLPAIELTKLENSFNEAEFYFYHFHLLSQQDDFNPYLYKAPPKMTNKALNFVRDLLKLKSSTANELVIDYHRKYGTAESLKEEEYKTRKLKEQFKNKLDVLKNYDYDNEPDEETLAVTTYVNMDEYKSSAEKDAAKKENDVEQKTDKDKAEREAKSNEEIEADQKRLNAKLLDLKENLSKAERLEKLAESQPDTTEEQKLGLEESVLNAKFQLEHLNLLSKDPEFVVSQYEAPERNEFQENLLKEAKMKSEMVRRKEITVDYQKNFSPEKVEASKDDLKVAQEEFIQALQKLKTQVKSSSDDPLKVENTENASDLLKNGSKNVNEPLRKAPVVLSPVQHADPNTRSEESSLTAETSGRSGQETTANIQPKSQPNIQPNIESNLNGTSTESKNFSEEDKKNENKAKAIKLGNLLKPIADLTFDDIQSTKDMKLFGLWFNSSGHKWTKEEVESLAICPSKDKKKSMKYLDYFNANFCKFIAAFDPEAKNAQKPFYLMKVGMSKSAEDAKAISKLCMHSSALKIVPYSLFLALTILTVSPFI